MALKPITRQSTTTCVSTVDPAVDHERSEKATEGMAKGAALYLTERLKEPASWRKLLALHDGQRPTVFTIGIVPVSDLVRIEDECTAGTLRPSELYWRCFLAGLRDMHDGPVNDDGEVPKIKVDGVDYVDPAWLRRTFVGELHKVAIEIGQCVYQWQNKTQVEIKN